ncbi:MAG: hypothetical protein L7F78_09275 [Syntrophales bacterium LBB04]|nr:hypothetical protein [Syntrophales bacterium LBB04]
MRIGIRRLSTLGLPGKPGGEKVEILMKINIEDIRGFDFDREVVCLNCSTDAVTKNFKRLKVSIRP